LYDRSPRRFGSLAGAIGAIVLWQFVIRPIVVDALDYSGGFNLPLLILAGVSAVIGALAGSAVERALAGRNRRN